MTLREELQAIPDVQHSDHSAVDALIRYITGPPEEAVQMIFVLHERYPALKQIIELVDEIYDTPNIKKKFPQAGHYAHIGATLGFLCLKEIAEQQLMDPSADPEA